MSSHRKTKSAAQAAGDAPQGMSERNLAPALLMFGDSSGNPSRSPRAFESGSHYIVCTATLDPLEMVRVDSEMNRIKQKHFRQLDPLYVEFHGSVLTKFLGKHIQGKKQINKKLSGIYEDLVTLVCTMNAQINMVVLDKVSPKEDYDHSIIEKKSWATVASMFAQKVNTEEPSTVGIPILDIYDRATTITINRVFGHISAWPTQNHKTFATVALSSPVYASSRRNNLIQLVDMIAYVVARHYRRGDEANFERWHDLLCTKFNQVARLAA